MSGLPTTGIYPVKVWAAGFEISEARFRDWIDEYKIPYFKPGRSYYIAAEDLWACVPRVTHGE